MRIAGIRCEFNFNQKSLGTKASKKQNSIGRIVNFFQFFLFYSILSKTKSLKKIRLNCNLSWFSMATLVISFWFTWSRNLVFKLPINQFACIWFGTANELAHSIGNIEFILSLDLETIFKRLPLIATICHPDRQGLWSNVWTPNEDIKKFT